MQMVNYWTKSLLTFGRTCSWLASRSRSSNVLVHRKISSGMLFKLAWLLSMQSSWELPFTNGKHRFSDIFVVSSDQESCCDWSQLARFAGFLFQNLQTCIIISVVRRPIYHSWSGDEITQNIFHRFCRLQHRMTYSSKRIHCRTATYLDKNRRSTQKYITQ